MKDALLLICDVGELAQGKVLAIRRGDQQILDGVHVLAVRLLHADQQVELALSLNDLGSSLAADGGLHDGVDVIHIEPDSGRSFRGSAQRSDWAGPVREPP